MTATEPTATPRPLSNLWNRDFTILWLGQMQSAFGDAFLTVGLMWMVLEKTGSSMAAATLLALEGAPKILGPLAGTVVDRGNKRRLMIGCDLLRGVFLIALFALHQRGWLQTYMLYAAAALEGALGLIYTPSLRVVLPSLVPDKKLTAANASLQGGQQVATIAGAALAGVSLAAIGGPSALLIDGASFVLAAVGISAIRFPTRPRADGKAKPPTMARDLVEGLRFVFSTTEVLLITAVVFFSNLVLSPINVIFPVFSQDVLGQGVRGFGFLSASIAFGLLAGAIFAGSVGDRLPYSRAILIGLSGLCASLTALSLVHTLWPAVVIVVFLGIVAPLIQVPVVSRLQRVVPKELQGRVFATMTSLVSLALPAGAAVFGRAMVAMQVPVVIRLAAAGCAVVALIWWVGGVRGGAATATPEAPTEEPADASAATETASEDKPADALETDAERAMERSTEEATNLPEDRAKEAPQGAPLVRLESLTKVYQMGEVDVHALRDVSLELRRGEMVAIMGASGSGKSTTLNVIGALDRPTSGRYFLDGEPVEELNDLELAHLRNQKIGFVFQSFNLLPRDTALQNVELPMIYARVSSSARRERARRALQRVGLADREDHLPNQLSGGQQQRVSIARAIVNEPLLLLADEPTGALDSETTKQVMELFCELDRQGITVVIVTHDPNIASYATRLITFKDGAIVSDTKNGDRSMEEA